MIKGLVAVGALFISLSAQAGALDTASELRIECMEAERVNAGNAKNPDAMLINSCVNYLQGVRDALAYDQAVRNALGNNSGHIVCIPEEVQLSQLVRATVRYIEDRPEWNEMYKVPSVYAALKDAYPCK